MLLLSVISSTHPLTSFLAMSNTSIYPKSIPVFCQYEQNHFNYSSTLFFLSPHEPSTLSFCDSTFIFLCFKMQPVPRSNDLDLIPPPPPLFTIATYLSFLNSFLNSLSLSLSPLSPFFLAQFNFTSQLVQAVELNLLLGAEHFFLYNTSISAATDTVIRHYQALGIFTVVQWPVPDESWYFAQVRDKDRHTNSHYYIFIHY